MRLYYSGGSDIWLTKNVCSVARMQQQHLHSTKSNRIGPAFPILIISKLTPFIWQFLWPNTSLWYSEMIDYSHEMNIPFEVLRDSLNWNKIRDWSFITAGIVQSSFWIHVNVDSTCLTGNLGSRLYDGMNRPSLVWVTLDPSLSDGLSGGLNPSLVWLTWIQKLDCTPSLKNINKITMTTDMIRNLLCWHQLEIVWETKDLGHLWLHTKQEKGNIDK